MSDNSATTSDDIETKPKQTGYPKLPPYSLDSEEVALGSLLVDADKWYEVSKILKPEDFYREKNRWVYESMERLRKNKLPIDQITVAHDLEGRIEEGSNINLLKAAGGAAYLSHLVYQVPTSVHAVYYAKIVARLAWKRKFIAIGNALAGMGYNIDEKTSESWLKAAVMLFALIKPLEEKQPKRELPIPIEEIKQAVKAAPPERSKQEPKKQYKGGVQV